MSDEFKNRKVLDLKSSKVLIKFDIEGFEYNLLSHLSETGALCFIDKILCEFHPYQASKTWGTLERALSFPNILKNQTGCKTIIVDFNDESYSEV